MTGLVAAPQPSHRLIPSQYPPIGLFDTVATAADVEAVMELAGWTNDRLVPERLHRLPESEWVHGRANSSIVLAAFLHVAPGGSRFNGPDLGAWYGVMTRSGPSDGGASTINCGGRRGTSGSRPVTQPNKRRVCTRTLAAIAIQDQRRGFGS